MERVEYIKKTFFEILRERYEGITFSEKDDTVYPKTVFFLDVFHTDPEWLIKDRCLTCVWDIQFRIPDKTFIKYLEITHDIMSGHIELCFNVYRLPGTKIIPDVIREKLEAAGICYFKDSIPTGAIALYTIYSNNKFVLFRDKWECHIPFTERNIANLYNAVDDAIEEVRKRAGYVDRREQCKKTILMLIWCCKLNWCKDMGPKIGRFLWETRYDEEWDILQIKKRKRLKIV